MDYNIMYLFLSACINVDKQTSINALGSKDIEFCVFHIEKHKFRKKVFIKYIRKYGTIFSTANVYLRMIDT